MSCCEPTLSDMLADPIVQAVMQADAVDRQVLEALLSDVARERAAAEPPAAGRQCTAVRGRHQAAA